MRLINDDVIIASFSSIDSVYPCEPIMCTVPNENTVYDIKNGFLYPH